MTTRKQCLTSSSGRCRTARENRLLPVLLGDLFHVPRDNANWLIAQFLTILQGKVLTVIGNHDLSEDRLCPHDSLSVLLAADRLHRLDHSPWVGQINGVAVAIGGTNNGEKLPKAVDRTELGNPRWVFWISHHDIRFPGYDEAGRLDCVEIPGIDLVVNGHIHRQLQDVTSGGTTWCNPGNIARVGRSDATRQHVPGVLRLDVAEGGWIKTRIEAPHQPFEQVFYPVDAVARGQAGSVEFYRRAAVDAEVQDRRRRGSAAIDRGEPREVHQRAGQSRNYQPDERGPAPCPRQFPNRKPLKNSAGATSN